jgi:hypothetical protein
MSYELILLAVGNDRRPTMADAAPGRRRSRA